MFSVLLNQLHSYIGLVHIHKDHYMLITVQTNKII